MRQLQGEVAAICHKNHIFSFIFFVVSGMDTSKMAVVPGAIFNFLTLFLTRWQLWQVQGTALAVAWRCNWQSLGWTFTIIWNSSYATFYMTTIQGASRLLGPGREGSGAGCLWDRGGGWKRASHKGHQAPQATTAITLSFLSRKKECCHLTIVIDCFIIWNKDVHPSSIKRLSCCFGEYLTWQLTSGTPGPDR